MPKHRRSRSSGPGLRIVLVMVLVIAALGIGYAIGNNTDDDGQDVSSGSTSSTIPTSSTSTSLPSADIATAVWPFVDSDTRYTDPVEAARGFATEFVGFKNPTVGPFQQGDSRSGEVEVRTKISTPTTVFVRLMSDETWWVLGSATADIVVDEPATDDIVTSPLSLSGQARAYEGTVNVEIRQDGSNEPIGEGFVTGSGGADLGPFKGEVAFSKPTQTHGSLVFVTYSAEDGRINEAGVTRIRFR